MARTAANQMAAAAAANGAAFASAPHFSTGRSSSYVSTNACGTHSLRFLQLNPLKFKPSRAFSFRASASSADDSGTHSHLLHTHMCVWLCYHVCCLCLFVDFSTRTYTFILMK